MRDFASPAAGPAPFCFPRALVTVVLASVISGCRDNAVPPGPSGPTLELRELYSIPVPDSFQPTGATILSPDTILAWSSDADHLLLASHTNVRPFAEAVVQRPLAVGFAGRDRRLEVVDLAKRAIVELSRDGTAIAVHSLQSVFESIEVETAARDRRGWYLGGPDESGTYHVIFCDAGDDTRRAVSLGRKLEDERPISGYLSPEDSSVLLSLLRWPFEVVRVDSRGRPPIRFRPELPPKFAEALGLVEVGRNWIGQRAIPLDTGILHGIADLRSDRRVLIRYAEQGHTAAYRTLDVPVGMVASLPEARLLLAARNLGHLEFVLYSWHWVGRS